MSSIATSIPTGVMSNGPEWCIQGLTDIFDSTGPPFKYNECANSTRGTEKSDFQTFCCDGDIIDTERNMWSWWQSNGNYSSYPLQLENLVCCREGGVLQPGGIMPIDTDYTHCSPSLKPTPLASLAATNTERAALYLATYESASGDASGGLHDWTRTETPRCLWVQTTHPDVTMVEVNVPAAQITTLPPPTTDQFGWPLDTSTTVSRTEAPNPSDTSANSATPSSSRSAGVQAVGIDRRSVATSLVICLGLLLSAAWVV